MSGLQYDIGPTQFEAGFGYDGRFQTISSSDNLTALSGGARPATQNFLPSMLNRVTTVAQIGDSVLLPWSRAGLVICVQNATTNSMQVYGQGNETINGIAGATGVPQMGNSNVWYTCLTPGTWTAQGIGSGQAGSQTTYSYQTGVTAATTQTQAAGTPITQSQVQISVCAHLNDAVTLMPAIAGMELTIINNGSFACNVFPASATQGGVSGGDQINTLGQNNAFSLAASTPTIFYCFVTGTWITK